MAVQVHCERVDAQGVGEDVESLAEVADAVCSAEPEGVVEVTVDAFGVVTATVEPFEVGVAGRDWSDVLGAVEAAFAIVVVAVQPDGDDRAGVIWREPVVVVPPVGPGFGGAPVGSDALERYEREFTGLGKFAEPDLAATGEKLHVAGT